MSYTTARRTGHAAYSIANARRRTPTSRQPPESVPSSYEYSATTNRQPSTHRCGRHRRSGSPLNFQRLHDQREFIHLFAGEVVELQILEQVNAIDDERDLVHRVTQIRIGVRGDAYGPVVSADQHRILLRQPFRGAGCQAWIGFQITRRGRIPQAPPSGVDDRGIAGLQRQLLPLQRLLKIGGRNGVRIAQHRHTLESGHVDEHASRDERTDMFYAELREAGARRHIANLDAVVQTVVDRLMREAVELRADLA